MIRFFPESASSVAGEVDSLYGALLLLTVFIVSIVAFAILFFAVKYRRGSKADRSNPSSGFLLLEIGWAVIPLLLAIGLFAWGADLYARIQRPPEGALQIHVVAKQWMWKVQHAQGRREIDTLHVPAGEAVRLLMTSEDVIHSFFAPAFRVKQDVVPGKYTSLWFQAVEEGRYPLYCAEYCGTNHSRMRGEIVVMAPGDYARWLQTGEALEPMAEAGARLFRELGCSGCHGEHSVVRAPSLDGLYGCPVPLNDGGIILADEAYLRDSILLPASKIVAGYENVMPSYDGQLSEEQIFQIIAYLRAIAGDAPALRLNEGRPE